MRYQKLSPRQNLAMTWWNRPGFGDYDGIICDGSIRSGKTVAMTVGFIMWAMCRFQGQNFALCGKTIESLRRNVTTNLPTWLAGVFSFREYRTENKIVVSAAGRSNNFYLFGGRDESSASLIQGITLAGVLLDEVALMPRSFVEQACARCSVEGSKLWFNCNPEGPSHWFYLTWVLEAGKRNMLHLHFTMDDNLSLSAAVKARYYFDSRKEGRQRTDEEHYFELERLAGDLPIRAVIVDPSAASFIEAIRRHGRFYVEKASNAVLDGIRDVATRLQSGDIFICSGCTDCIREFGLYRWDEKAPMDRPIKENDHAMDDVRYFVHKIFGPQLFSF